MELNSINFFKLHDYLDKHVVEMVYPPGFKHTNRMFILAFNTCFPGVSRFWLETYIMNTYLSLKYGIDKEKVDTIYGSMTATEVVTWFKVH